MFTQKDYFDLEQVFGRLFVAHLLEVQSHTSANLFKWDMKFINTIAVRILSLKKQFDKLFFSNKSIKYFTSQRFILDSSYIIPTTSFNDGYAKIAIRIGYHLFGDVSKYFVYDVIQEFYRDGSYDFVLGGKDVESAVSRAIEYLLYHSDPAEEKDYENNLAECVRKYSDYD